MSIVKPKHPDEYQGQMFSIDHWWIKKKKVSWQRPTLPGGRPLVDTSDADSVNNQQGYYLEHLETDNKTKNHVKNMALAD